MKKYTIKFTLLLWLSVILVIGCKENEMLEYENDPALYFTNVMNRQQIDSLTHSFFYIKSDAMRDTLYLTVTTMGYPSDIDRPIVLEQTNIGKSDAAAVGKHYVAFDNPEVKSRMIVPAGKVSAEIPIILLRDESLKLMTVRFEIKIGQNEYFRPGISRYTQFTITTTAMAAKPHNWDTWWYLFFGRSWGTEKMKFIIDHTGLSDWNNTNVDIDYIQYLSAILQQKLLEYNTEHPLDPLREADNTLVTFNE